MLDLANKTVKGSCSGSKRNRHTVKQEYHQWERTQARRTYRHLRDFRCSGDLECDCPGCSCDLSTTESGRDRDVVYSGIARCYFYFRHSLDDLGGALRSATVWARRLGSSDEFYSWVKHNYPDTLAGRHAIGHVMAWIPIDLGCGCEYKYMWDPDAPKGRLGQCTCGAFLPKEDRSAGDLLTPEMRYFCRRGAFDFCRRGAFGEVSGADLSDWNLEEANLSGWNLVDTNLTGANLTGANLTGADLLGACLVEANLTGANLEGASLWYASLTGANLTGANLTGADLEGACLKGADLTRAKWSQPGSTEFTGPF
jgi:hypothetical protein